MHKAEFDYEFTIFNFGGMCGGVNPALISSAIIDYN
jgi:hypothetical protein